MKKLIYYTTLGLACLGALSLFTVHAQAPKEDQIIAPFDLLAADADADRYEALIRESEDNILMIGSEVENWQSHLDVFGSGELLENISLTFHANGLFRLEVTTIMPSTDQRKAWQINNHYEVTGFYEERSAREMAFKPLLCTHINNLSEKRELTDRFLDPKFKAIFDYFFKNTTSDPYTQAVYASLQAKGYPMVDQCYAWTVHSYQRYSKDAFQYARIYPGTKEKAIEFKSSTNLLR
ncbi:MAG: hypothetical protein HC880_20695 [Bacteroidia bacterium]|nr:hypothetical protein [Bacteroidia bacterium]